jgi:hypothetical protein
LRAGPCAEYAKGVLDGESIERELGFAQLAALLQIAAKLFSSVH